MKLTAFIGGFHAVTAALQQSPQDILCLYVQQNRHDQRLQKLLVDAKAQGIAVQTVSVTQLDTWLAGVKHQGVAAQCREMKARTETDLETLLSNLSQPALLLILDGVQDPHNLGACLRSANAAGVHAVIAPKDHSVDITPAVRKVACGAAEVTPFIQVTNLARTLRALKEQGVWLLGMDGEAPTNLYQSDLQRSIGFVLGAEGKGMRRLTREHCDELLSIPMAGSVASLNVSVATGICLFEAIRQREKIKI